VNRRQFSRVASLAGATLLLDIEGSLGRQRFVDTPQGRTWLTSWERNITGEARNRYCDKETGEELGWLVSPFLEGFHYGYVATRDSKWIDRLVDWTDSCIRRAVREPDGFPGWPKGDGGGGDSREYSADSLLGEAMMLRPAVLTAHLVRNTPSLQAKYGSKAQSYIDLAEKIFEKWDSRSCWRTVETGGVWVVPTFGLDLRTGQWSSGHADRKTTGFTNPFNKQNLIVLWLLALHDATQKAVYRERAELWFRTMKSRIKTRENGKYLVWNYWEPAGPWDYVSNGSPKHWIGVHPNGGYYDHDAEAMVNAYEHGLVFTKADVDSLIATNRDFMWNRSVTNARFKRIDGGDVDPRWPNTPGVLWEALVPYDRDLESVFIANHNPSSWSALGTTPWYLGR
jgi:hypothetical protein